MKETPESSNEDLLFILSLRSRLHIDETVMASYVAGLSPDDEIRRVEEHLSTCRPCREECAELRASCSPVDGNQIDSTVRLGPPGDPLTVSRSYDGQADPIRMAASCGSHVIPQEGQTSRRSVDESLLPDGVDPVPVASLGEWKGSEVLLLTDDEDSVYLWLTGPTSRDATPCRLWVNEIPHPVVSPTPQGVRMFVVIGIACSKLEKELDGLTLEGQEKEE